MDNKRIEEQRQTITDSIIIALKASFRLSKYHNDREDNLFFDKCSTMIEYVNDALAKNSDADLKLLLGGEFPKAQYSSTKLPLYFILDYLIYAIKNDFLTHEPNTVRGNQILAKLTVLRGNVVRYNDSKYFDPRKSHNPKMFSNMLASNGHFETKLIEEYDKKYIGISSITTSEDIKDRDGDILSNGAVHFYCDDLVYLDDQEEIERVGKNQEIDFYDKIVAVAGKYFVGGKLPEYDSFHRSLVDHELDDRIRVALFSIVSVLKERKGLAAAQEIEYYIKTILTREKQLLEEKSKREAHSKAIDEARDRYNSKNFLWRFAHRKLNPDRMSLDEMTTEELNALYGGKVK